MKILFESAFIINQEIKKLISKEALNSFSNTNYQGDNANYCTSLFSDYLIDPNEANKSFLFYMGKQLFDWAEKKLHNGYFKMEDAHHGTELFLGFLPRYIDIFPDDQNAKNLILDVAEHIGNWSNNTNDWFDYSNNNLCNWHCYRCIISRFMGCRNIIVQGYGRSYLDSIIFNLFILF